MQDDDEVAGLLAGAAASGVLSAQSSSLITGNLGKMVIAGAAGKALEDIVASDVTLITVLIDASSSIHDRGLEQAVRDGQNHLIDAFAGAKQKDAILMALWTFSSNLDVLHSYLPVTDAVRLDPKNYRGNGSTRLYDTWCDALAANVAYAQRLMQAGVPVDLRVYAGAPHGFDGFAPDAAVARQCRRDVNGWLARALAGPG